MPTDESVSIIAQALYDPSELLAHEAAYCLGQMKNPTAIQYLKKALEDTTLPVVVRHEAGEAIGAINDISTFDLLDKYSKDPSVEVAETCMIAKQRLVYYSVVKESDVDKLYGSVDPAPPHTSTNADMLDYVLLNEDMDLFDRYRAMFALRNIGTDECALSLAAGFQCKSALFRHEIAFVLGQMRKPITVDALGQVVRNTREHPMVRHEAAEALGNIATTKCIDILECYKEDPERIVMESCLIGLGISSYQNSKRFEYVH
ncbi:Deoxyhypusine hydroxylase [Thelohanellus kitauei]|uniref:Deoxyhypusine hydroxylase n=1 Tax=Thelohanellus kitauei TaxID=669202 RepID=A0A0C2MPU2_THEKT|nr:Deoxyhypusine hydroxylase [Thelohanellus kitauei]